MDINERFAPLKWKRNTYSITIAGGIDGLSVTGYTSDFFGIHKEYSWVLTHLPTGKRISYLDKLVDAKDFAARIEPLAAWGEDTGQDKGLAAKLIIIRGNYS